jgi:hypothetical protein
MAESALTPQSMVPGGTEVTFEAANVDGNFFENTGKMFLWVKNGSASPITVNIDSPTNCNYGFAHDVSVVITAGEDRLIGLFATARFNDSSKYVHITYTAVTTVTVALVTT